MSGLWVIFEAGADGLAFEPPMPKEAIERVARGLLQSLQGLDPAARRALVGAEFRTAGRPKIVCLCGSTRFYETWQQANFDETLAGRIVLSVGFYPHAADKAHAAHVGITPEQKVALDALHKHKIDLADEILVLNVGGYIGESTTREIRHAIATGKPVRWWEPDAIPEAFAPLRGQPTASERSGERG